MRWIKCIKKQWLRPLNIEIQLAGKIDDGVEEKSAKNIGNIRQ
jgi:hypothetical protein